jgi:eukaryotic-like serine/threonine-protein kinase
MKESPSKPPSGNEPSEARAKPPPLPSRERSGVMTAAPAVGLVLKPGAVIAGKYRLERKLSQGGMGSVWAATHLSLDTPVAIKFMTVRLADDPNAALEAREAAFSEARARFEREARAAAHIRMANVVQILDYGIDTNVPYIVMELLVGEDLEARLGRVKRLSPAQAAKILVPIARALQRAHELGLVHRDLKPANIFLAREADNEVPKILDFGVAKAIAVEDRKPSEVTHEGIVLGTPHYMSPEQALNHGIDARSDLWSLGVILFRALTGKRPFEGSGMIETVVAICTARIPKATEMIPELPPEIDEFFARALARDRTKRFQSAREMSQAFAERFRGPNTSWPPPGPPPPAESPRPEPVPTSKMVSRPDLILSKLQDSPEQAVPAPAAEPASSPQWPVDLPATVLDSSISTRRKRLRIGVVVAVSGLVTLIALASIFGRSAPEPSNPEPPSSQIAITTAAPPKPVAPLETQAAPAETAQAPAASASAAASRASETQRRTPTRSGTKASGTARPAGTKSKPKRKRDLGY